MARKELATHATYRSDFVLDGLPTTRIDDFHRDTPTIAPFGGFLGLTYNTILMIRPKVGMPAWTPCEPQIATRISPTVQGGAVC